MSPHIPSVQHALRAGVRVPSTSNRQMVFLTGRWSSAGMTDAAAAAIVSEMCTRGIEGAANDGKGLLLCLRFRGKMCCEAFRVSIKGPAARWTRGVAEEGPCALTRRQVNSVCCSVSCALYRLLCLKTGVCNCFFTTCPVPLMLFCARHAPRQSGRRMQCQTLVQETANSKQPSEHFISCISL